MGWWEQGRDGSSFERSSVDDDNLMMWGDGPADLVGKFLYELKIEFLRDLGRMPSQDEVIAGLKFSTRVLDDLAKQPYEVPHATATQARVIRQYGYAATGGDTVASQRERDAHAEVGKVLKALSVKTRAEHEGEESGPIWTAVFVLEENATDRLPFSSYDDALAYLLHNWDGGVLSPRELIYPDGTKMDRDTLWKILVGRREI